MRIARASSKYLAAMVALFVFILPPLPAGADSGTAGNNPQAKKLCYCGCDMAPGATACAHLCELPKYQDRWWATNCRRTIREISKKPSPSQHSKKLNRKEQARLN
jgi:hypothetical protein